MRARPRRMRLPRPERRLGAAVLAALAVTLVLALLAARPLLTLLAEDDSAPAAAVPAAAPAAFKQDMDLALARFRGRSLFFTPPPPPPPVAREPDRGPSGPPARYGGPALVAMIGDTAWFADGRRLVAGADAPEGGDLRVVETSPPWYARVAWQGGEYTVTLFDRTGATSAVTSPPPAPAGSTPGADRPPRPESPPDQPPGPAPEPQPSPEEPGPDEPEPGEPEPDPEPQPEPDDPPAPPQPPPQPAPQPQPQPNDPAPAPPPAPSPAPPPAPEPQPSPTPQ